jgi:hypothetical protein
MVVEELDHPVRMLFLYVLRLLGRAWEVEYALVGLDLLMHVCGYVYIGTHMRFCCLWETRWGGRDCTAVFQ